MHVSVNMLTLWLHITGTGCHPFIEVFIISYFILSFLYLHPTSSSTPHNSVHAKAFQEEIQSIRKEFKADVVGISDQGAESKQKFAQELGLDFSILADEGDAVRKEFGVPKAAFGFLPGRVTYVLDKDGVCTSVYDNLADAASHIEKAKEALAEIQPAKKAGFNIALPF